MCTLSNDTDGSDRSADTVIIKTFCECNAVHKSRASEKIIYLSEVSCEELTSVLSEDSSVGLRHRFVAFIR